MAVSTLQNAEALGRQFGAPAGSPSDVTRVQRPADVSLEGTYSCSCLAHPEEAPSTSSTVHAGLSRINVRRIKARLNRTVAFACAG